MAYITQERLSDEGPVNILQYTTHIVIARANP